MADCIHDLPIEQCGFCTKPKVDLTVPVKTGPTITASQTSPCGNCGEKIDPGETITMTDEGWVHDSHLPHRNLSGPPQTDASMFEGIE